MIIHVILCFWHPIVLNLMLSIYVIIYENHVLTFFITQTNDVMITSLLCQPNVAMSFWRINDVIMTLCVRWEYVLLSFNSQFHWGFSHKLVALTARVFLWIQTTSPIGRNTNCWPQVRQWHAGEQFGSLVCWQLFDVATEFHGDGRGVPLNQNASKIHIKVYR